MALEECYQKLHQTKSLPKRISLFRIFAKVYVEYLESNYNFVEAWDADFYELLVSLETLVFISRNVTESFWRYLTDSKFVAWQVQQVLQECEEEFYKYSTTRLPFKEIYLRKMIISKASNLVNERRASILSAASSSSSSSNLHMQLQMQDEPLTDACDTPAEPTSPSQLIVFLDESDTSDASSTWRSDEDDDYNTTSVSSRSSSDRSVCSSNNEDVDIEPHKKKAKTASANDDANAEICSMPSRNSCIIDDSNNNSDRNNGNNISNNISNNVSNDVSSSNSSSSSSSSSSNSSSSNSATASTQQLLLQHHLRQQQLLQQHHRRQLELLQQLQQEQQQMQQRHQQQQLELQQKQQHEERQH